MYLLDGIRSGNEKISIIGLGYVGLTVAAAFADKGVKVIGFDMNREKLDLFRAGVDPAQEVGNDAIRRTTVEFTCEESRLQEARFHIVAVPVPVNRDHTPDLSPVIRASMSVGRSLKEGSIVVFESTAYPGMTEDVCIPVLELESGLKAGRDFKVGYSPERINPGDRLHCLENITKIVSGMDEESLDIIAGVYSIAIHAGTHRVSSIRAAEAIEAAENSQRDINIAFMNELAIVFDRLGIDTLEVAEGMDTKWNGLRFRPGLAGGHCIGVDPCYFAYGAEKMGYHSQILRAGRNVNDGMGFFVADAAIKQMVLAGKAVRDARVVILGMTFKENYPDIRNSKVNDMIKRLKEYGINPFVMDPLAVVQDADSEYGVTLLPFSSRYDADCIILAVAHDIFRKLTLQDLNRMFRDVKQEEKVLIDVKSILDKAEAEKAGFRYWRL